MARFSLFVVITQLQQQAVAVDHGSALHPSHSTFSTPAARSWATWAGGALAIGRDTGIAVDQGSGSAPELGTEKLFVFSTVVLARNF